MMIEAKVCENCNHKNPVTAVECEKCGYDLTFVFPQKVDENDQKPVASDEASSCPTDNSSGWSLVSAKNEKIGILISGEMSVGRDCDVLGDLFNSSNFTSRIHAKLRLNGDTVQVMDASTNGTFVDEKRIGKMEWIDVAEGSTVRFADVEFKVRRNCNAN